MASMAEHKSGSFLSRLARRRSWVQTLFLVAWLNPVIRLHHACSPVFHCHSCPLATFACPVGVLANFSAIHVVPFVALGTLIVFGAIFGSFVCGWVCPFGFLQDLIGRIPTPKFGLPAWTGSFRYVVLVVSVLAIPYFCGEEHPLFFCRLCPAGALEAAMPHTASLAIAGQEIVWPSAAKTIILILILAAMLFKQRPWCALLCPLGAVYTLFNRVSIFFLQFRPEHCDECDRCRHLCHYHGRSERRAGTQRCVRCLNCMQCGAITVGSVFGGSGASRGSS